VALAFLFNGAGFPAAATRAHLPAVGDDPLVASVTSVFVNSLRGNLPLVFRTIASVATVARSGSPCRRCRDERRVPGAQQGRRASERRRPARVSPRRSCAPCRPLEPRLDAFARRHAGELPVLAVDIVEDRATGQRFGVRSLPTLLVFRDEEQTARLDGLISGTDLDAALTSAS
jgi:thiol-disulfide isomerase/thioredoxin